MSAQAPPPDKKKGDPRPCRRCKVREGVHTMRDDPSCDTCFVEYVATKTVKRLEAMNKELNRVGTGPVRHATRTSALAPTPRYAVALSCGPSSAGMLHALYQTMMARRKRSSRATYELYVVHIDTRSVYHGEKGEDALGDPLQKWRERYPEAMFETAPLVPENPDVLRRLLPKSSPSPDQPFNLASFLTTLPSQTSRNDVSRILVQQQLMAWAADNKCDALLLGHTATALSELALSEVAKGRGYGVPWLMTDGHVPMRVGRPQNKTPDTMDDVDKTPEAVDKAPESVDKPVDKTPEPTDKPTVFPVYHLIKELFRSELELYAALLNPSFADLLPRDQNPATAPVVSLRDVSIDQVVARYFRDNDASYQSMVNNVVRTIGKLRKPDIDKPCVVCGLPVDDQGDERWYGEIPDDGDSRNRRRPDGVDWDEVCYGCKRSLYG